MLIKLQFLKHLSSAQHDACDSEMTAFLCMAWSSDREFHMKHLSGVPLVIYQNSDIVDQIVVPQSSGFHELFIEKLYVTPLATQFSVQKLNHALFQRVWWHKPCEIVTSFVYSCTICIYKKKNKQFCSPSSFAAAPSSPRISLLLMKH